MFLDCLLYRSNQCGLSLIGYVTWPEEHGAGSQETGISPHFCDQIRGHLGWVSSSPWALTSSKKKKLGWMSVSLLPAPDDMTLRLYFTNACPSYLWHESPQKNKVSNKLWKNRVPWSCALSKGDRFNKFHPCTLPASPGQQKIQGCQWSKPGSLSPVIVLTGYQLSSDGRQGAPWQLLWRKLEGYCSRILCWVTELWGNGNQAERSLVLSRFNFILPGESHLKENWLTACHFMQ